MKHLLVIFLFVVFVVSCGPGKRPNDTTVTLAVYFGDKKLEEILLRIGWVVYQEEYSDFKEWKPKIINKGEYEAFQQRIKLYVETLNKRFNEAFGFSTAELNFHIFSGPNFEIDLAEIVKDKKRKVELYIGISSEGGLEVEKYGKLGYFITFNRSESHLSFRTDTLLPLYVPKNIFRFSPTGKKEDEIRRILATFLKADNKELVATFCITPGDLATRVVFAEVLRKALMVYNSGKSVIFVGDGYSKSRMKFKFALRVNGSNFSASLFGSNIEKGPSNVSIESLLEEVVEGSIYAIR